MALIEVFHVVASHFPIDAANATDIPQGSLVALDPTTGDIVLANGEANTLAGTGNGRHAIGIAGDSRSSGVTSYTPESGSALSNDPKTTMEGALVLGAWGAQERFTQNRAADNYNEVLASGKMTVYHSGGEFWTDQYDTTSDDSSTALTYNYGSYLYASAPFAAAQGMHPASNGGKFTTENNDGTTSSAGWRLVGICLHPPTAYPSGVPGTTIDFTHGLPEGANSLSWGTFLHVKLCI